MTVPYSRQTARDLGAHAVLVYEDWPVVDEALAGQGFIHRIFYEKGETEAYLATDFKQVVVAFRGTSSLRDLLTDIKFTKTFESKGRCHRGFVHGLNLVWKKLLADLTDWQLQGLPILITGHSLGAALATLASARFWHMGLENSLYTFGSPRVGDRDFADAYTELAAGNAHRYVNNNDMVTRVPPRSFGYKHVGGLHYFMENGRQSDKLSDWQRFLDSVDGRIKDFGEAGTDGLKDHFGAQYYSNLVQAAK